METLKEIIKQRQKWFEDYKKYLPEKEWSEIKYYIEIWMTDAYMLNHDNASD